MSRAALVVTVVVTALTLVALALPVHAANLTKLSAPPQGEQWFSIIMGDQRVGFAHLNIVKSDTGYRIDTESSVKMGGIGFSRDATTRASYLVGNDLALRSFTADNRIDQTRSRLTGEATPQGVRVVIETDGTRKQRTLAARGAVYPPEALNIYPLLRAAQVGKSYKVPMLDVDSVKVKQVKVEVVGEESLSGTPAVHLRNNLYPIVDNDIWVDLQGKTLKESVRDDFILTLAEDEAIAKLHLVDAALAKQENIFDFSLIPVAPQIGSPADLKKLSVEFTGIPQSQALLQSKTQRATRLSDGKVVFTLPNPDSVATHEEPTQATDLAATDLVPSGHPDTVARKTEILGGETNPVQAARLLSQWVAREIKLTAADGHSPQDALKSRSGNSQNHARIYAALARAAGIPTRLVYGLVYLPRQGFLYHSWAESYLNGWVAVDPSYGQFPADLTHIILVEGDAPEGISVLAGMIGKVQARVVEQQ